MVDEKRYYQRQFLLFFFNLNHCSDTYLPVILSEAKSSGYSSHFPS